MKHINITFLPGAAGNFLARAVALSSQCIYGDMHQLSDLTFSAEDKFNMYSYSRFKKVRQESQKIRRLCMPSPWQTMENFLMPLCHNNFPHAHPEDHLNHNHLPEDHYIVNWSHGHHFHHLDYRKSDTFPVLIKSHSMPQWTYYNAVHKDSAEEYDKWTAFYDDQLNDDIVLKVELSDFFEESTFNALLISIMQYVGITEYDTHYALKLRNEWIETILTYDNIQSAHVGLKNEIKKMQNY